MKPRWFCSRCHAELTDADREAGECTQCHRALPTRDHKQHLDVTVPQLQAEFRISYERGKQIQEVLKQRIEYLKKRDHPYEMSEIDLITELAKEFD